MAAPRPSSYEAVMSDARPDPLEDAAQRDRDPARGRPKDAATLILVRRDGPEPRLLVGRRSAGHAFMPAKWVFPGGRVDRADHRAPVLGELPPEVERLLARTAPKSRAGLPRALAVAACRETYEETGLVLGRTDGDRLLPDLRSLSFVAHAITPPGRVRRFDARFFSTDADALANLERTPGTGELEEIAWFTTAEALELDLPSITRFVVSEIAARETDPARPVPSVRMVRGRKRVEPI
jgi:8-oxo-dGTP pyrophosphatase MutT (NUDIX family)